MLWPDQLTVGQLTVRANTFRVSACRTSGSPSVPKRSLINPSYGSGWHRHSTRWPRNIRQRSKTVIFDIWQLWQLSCVAGSIQTNITSTGSPGYTSAWCAGLISSPPKQNMTRARAGLRFLMWWIKQIFPPGKTLREVSWEVTRLDWSRESEHSLKLGLTYLSLNVCFS